MILILSEPGTVAARMVLMMRRISGVMAQKILMMLTKLEQEAKVDLAVALAVRGATKLRALLSFTAKEVSHEKEHQKSITDHLQEC